jgi:hypothetical protein
MANGFIVLDEETWKAATVEQRALMTFNTLKSIDTRLSGVERWNKCFSFLGGAVGGVLANLGIKWGG